MKTCERLRKIKALDRYIESQMNQLQKLESQALKINASPLQADKVQNGSCKKKDDLYIELMATREMMYNLFMRSSNDRKLSTKINMVMDNHPEWEKKQFKIAGKNTKGFKRKIKK